MKRIGIFLSIFLTAAMLFACCGCGASTPSTDRFGVISQEEYVLYQQVFYNDYGSKLDGKTVEKHGVLATLHDAFKNVDRYYVWGYYDNTKCCDWQWEFIPVEGAELPPDGSLVTVKGKFASDDRALDKYLIQDASVTTNTEYTGSSYDVNMYVMSDTLERVQIANVKRLPDSFQDKTFSAYGRIKTMTSIQDPYYNESWEIGFTWDGDVPAIGTTVLITGTVSNGTLILTTLQTIE